MASFKVGLGLRDFTDDDDDVSAIIGEYSIPNLAEITSDSLLTKSQYAKVIFHDLLPSYPTDADIWCRYSLTDGIASRHGDRVALYRVGWSSVHEHVQFEVAPVSNNVHDRDFQVLFKAEALPKDATEFYQLCYVNVDDSVCGASVPFQFRRPAQEELCEVEEQGGLLVVRSRTAVNGDKLRDAAKTVDALECEKLAHPKRIETAKDRPSLGLGELSDVERRETRLDVDSLERDRSEANERIRSVASSIGRDNSALTELLRNQAVSQEVSHFKAQVDNMQQMLDALTQSKEMASQALRCEQSKVMTLNVEHDKYKYRAQHLEEENRVLRAELQRGRNQIQDGEQRAREAETLLQTRAIELAGASNKLAQLIKQVGQMQFDVRQSTEINDSLRLQLKQRDSQIAVLDMELKDTRTRGGSFDQLNEEYANLKRQLRDCASVHAAAESLTRDNLSLRERTHRLQDEVRMLLECRAERDAMSSEFELLSVKHAALQEELFESVNGSFVQDLQENNASLRCRLQHAETTNRTAASMEELRHRLSVAEASNSSLMHQLGRIKDFRPVDRVNCGPSLVAEALGDNVGCPVANRPPVKNLLLKQMYQTLKEDKGKLELELQEVTSRESVHRSRSDAIAGRLAEIEEDAAQTRTELQAAIAKSRRDRDDLIQINNRMASVQQQLLLDDQREGRDFRDNSDQERLERMSKRSHDLQCSFEAAGFRIHDLEQNALVLEQERRALEEEVAAGPWVDKRAAEDKCRILEKLVNLDQGLITLREDLFVKSEAEAMDRSCSSSLGGNLPTGGFKKSGAEVMDRSCSSSLGGNLPAGGFKKSEAEMMDRSCSDSLGGNLLPAGEAQSFEDAIVPEVRINVSKAKAEDNDREPAVSTTAEEGKVSTTAEEGEVSTTAEGGKVSTTVEGGEVSTTVEGGEVSTTAGEGEVSTTVEGGAGDVTVERAVASGVREGLRHGMNALKLRATEELSPGDSLDSSTESLTTVERRCEVTERACAERERQLEEKLTVVLKDTVRKELLEGMLGGATTELGTSGVEADLKLRLELAADEYRKIYTQKLRLEKQLARVQQKQARATATQGCVVEASGYVCPICGVSFPANHSDTFTRHFEDHLS